MKQPDKINQIPHSLMDATYKQLQRMAKHYRIKAILQREELETALYEIIKSNSSGKRSRRNDLWRV